MLFILDEVQTGMVGWGRCGAFERWAFEPDIMTLAKGLGGGVPVGADAGQGIRRGVRARRPRLDIGGNPLMCGVIPPWYTSGHDAKDSGKMKWSAWRI